MSEDSHGVREGFVMMRSLRCAGWVVMALLAANGVGLQADHMAGGQGGGGGGPGGGGQSGQTLRNVFLGCLAGAVHHLTRKENIINYSVKICLACE